MARRKYPDLEPTVEDITPEIAREWLERNTHNRTVSDRLVEIYADAMEAKEWYLNGEPIIFDYNDLLQSGQHRLLAVILSNTTIRSVVVRGADPEALYSLDTGRKRKLTDALTLRGEKDVANLATAVTWYWRYEHGVMDRGGVTATTTTLLRTLDEHPALREAVAAVRSLHSALGVSCGLFGSVHYILSNISPDECESFFTSLTDGANLDIDGPIHSLRRWIIRSRRGERRPSSSVYAAVTIKAWNAYRDHQPLKAVRWAANEAFPEPV
jgi:hypothetical protein